MVLAASGVDHEELVKYAEPLLSDLPSVPRPKEPQSVYTGGDYRCHTGSGVGDQYPLLISLLLLFEN